jgi:hypothetical protein
VGDAAGVVVGLQLTPPPLEGLYDPRVHTDEDDALKGVAAPIRYLNHVYMNHGLNATKIAAMQYEAGLLWILYDNEQVRTSV